MIPHPKSLLIKTLVALLAFSSLIGCGYQSPLSQADRSNLKIVGGEVVSQRSQISRLTVGLVNAATKKPFCSGVLIAPDKVLTAAHCVAQVDFDIGVTRGLRVAKSKPIAVTGIQIHQEFNEANLYTFLPETPTNDLALLRLAKSLHLEAIDLELIARSLKSDEIYPLQVNTRITLAGFGITSAQTREGAGLLRAVETSIIDINAPANEFVFGGQRGKSACAIDSGGPAFITSSTTRDNLEVVRLIGISSRGSRDCMENGVYTLIEGLNF